MRRRAFLQALAALGGAALGGPAAFAAAETDRRFVLVILRGGMDGLAAVPAHGDPEHARARGDAAVPPPGADGGALDLDGTFGLHPALAPLLPLWEQGALLPLHAVAPPYRERSHFDGQDVLENGTDRPLGAATGWLNRALSIRRGGPPAMAIGRTVPLVLRGPAAATSADPTRPARPDDPWLRAVHDLYAGDPLLGPALDQGLATQAMLAGHQGPRLPGGRAASRDPISAIRVIGGVLAADDGPRIAVLEVGGWDTHTGQKGTLDRQLASVAGSLAALADAMGEAWSRTAVLACTEFGRTVKANGTGGTDHGTAGAALLAGGAVAGGRVHADWPGLSPDALLEGRDLRPTTDVRAVFKGVLRDHLGLDERALDREVFPDSAAVRPLDGLIRT